MTVAAAAPSAMYTCGANRTAALRCRHWAGTTCFVPAFCIQAKQTRMLVSMCIDPICIVSISHESLVLHRCGEVIPKQIVTVRLQHGLVPYFSRDFRLQTGVLQNETVTCNSFGSWHAE